MANRLYPRGWVLYLSAGGTWEFWLNSGSGMVSIGGGTSTLNTWHHVVGTFDGTTAALYVNGVAVGSGTVSAYQPQMGGWLEFAQGEPGSNFYFPGNLQEPAVYASALTPAQIHRHYTVGTTGQ
jgi:hypothetical protein